VPKCEISTLDIAFIENLGSMIVEYDQEKLARLIEKHYRRSLGGGRCKVYWNY
jgi:hypothetical protein